MNRLLTARPWIPILLCAPAWAQTPHWNVSGSWPSSTFGASIAGVGDVSGDGLEDLLIGDLDAAPALLLQGRANVHSGAGGGVLRTHHGSALCAHFGSSLGSAGDVDMGGVHDYLIGAPGTYGGTGPGSATMRSGATGALLHQFV